MKCSVLNCPHSSRVNGKEISFFRLPKSAKIAKKWLRFCGNPKIKLYKNAFVCSYHFKADDIIGAKEFVCKGYRRRLKQLAVPCIKKAPESEATKGRNKRRATRNDNCLVKEILTSKATKEDTPDPEPEPELEPEDNAKEEPEPTPAKLPAESNSNKIVDNLDTESSEAVIDELSNQIQDLQQENMRIKVNFQLLLKKSQSEVKELKRKLEQANSKILMLEMQMDDR